MQKIAIVIPTYNEKENLPVLIKKISRIAEENRLGMEIIVVDDNSPDGTGKLADKLALSYPVKVIHRAGKLGIGSAHIAGFKCALLEQKELIFTMDADLSHNPDCLVGMIKKANNGFDVVIGSRYVKGGGVRNWGIYRKLISFGANAISRLLLSIKAHDVTSGYRGYRAAVLKAIELNRIKSNGYSFLEEMLYSCSRHGFKIGEFPIVFIDRKAGKSKLSRIEAISFFMTMGRLFCQQLKRRVKNGD